MKLERKEIKTTHNNAYSLWRVNGYQQGFRSVASFGFGGQERASKPPQAICKPLYIMLKKLNYISIFVLILIGISCKNEKKNNGLNSSTESELKTDSINAYNELANPDKKEMFTISEYNTDNPEIENIKRPEKTIIRNLAIDTTQAFGIWTQDPNGPHADFWLTAKDFLVADYDGDGHMPYILDGNKITIFYNDFVQKGTITSTKNDTLKIKWADFDVETKYVKFEN